MFQRDYVLRLIEQFARAVTRVIGLRKQGEPAAAHAELAALTQSFLGINAKLLFSLTDVQLLSLFTVGDALDSGRAVLAEQILVEEAAIQDALSAPELAETYRLRGLSLLLEVLARDPLFRTSEYTADLNQLLEDAGDELPASHHLKLFRYFAATGRYADAENLLFELVESGVREAVAEGFAFYERLLTLEDAELARGNLPRREVEEGIAQLRKLGI